MVIHTLGCVLKVKTKTSANLKTKDFTELCWGPRGSEGLSDMESQDLFKVYFMLTCPGKLGTRDSHLYTLLDIFPDNFN